MKRDLHPTRLKSKAPPRGLSLIELALGLAALGCMLVVIMLMVDFRALRQNGDAMGQGAAQRAENALLAYAKTHRVLPVPERQEPSPFPGYLLGTVPWRQLGLPEGGAVAYLVDARMVQLPSARYQPNRLDPMPGRPGLPDALDGFDYLIQQEDRLKPSDLLPSRAQGPLQADYCVQLLRWSQTPQPIQDGYSAAFLTRPAHAQGLNEAQGRGIGEMATQLGCVELLSRLDGDITALYSSRDHVALAELNLEAARIGELAAWAGLINDLVRAPIWAGKLVINSIKMVEAINQMATSHDTGAAASAMTLAPLVSVEALFLYGSALNVYFIKVHTEGVGKAQAAVAASDAYLKRVVDEARLVQANLKFRMENM